MAKTDITKVNFFFPAAFVALGGMVYVMVTLFWVQGLACFWEEGRMIESTNTVRLFIPVMAAGVCALIVLLYIKSPSLMPASKIGTSQPYGGPDSATPTLLLIVLVGLMAICLITVGGETASLIIAASATATISYFLAHFFDKRPSVRGAVVGVWFLGYLILWILGASHPVNLPIFISFWVVFGGLAGYFLADMIRAHNIADKQRVSFPHKEVVALSSPPRSTTAGGAAVHDMTYRRRHTSANYSEFGRLPQDTANLLAHLVRRTTGPIAAALPVDASPAMTRDTTALILDNLLLDWRENNNLSGIDDTDVQDIRSFITFACTFADASYSAESRATYKTVLAFLLRDWLKNWNESGSSGPPKR